MTADRQLHHPIPRVSPGRLAWTLAAVALFGFSAVPGRSGRAADAAQGPDHLASRPRPTGPAVVAAEVGTEVRTTDGQRRRLLLPGGSVLYVDQNTTVKLDELRRLTLSAGAVFVEAPLAKEGKAAALVVNTSNREVTGRGAKFAVQAGESGTGVVVLRGTVHVSGVDGDVAAGQELAADSRKPVPSPRASHRLGWTRDLMAAAEPGLVPASRHAGGELVAIDPDGQEAKLSLRKYHIDVYIEDGFARTTIDQTFFNHEPARLEGTFYFPLPADASLSRLAMYVDGQRMEGGMVERDRARQVYETIRYRQQDPALLEWVDGSTFRMRVFPLEPRQEMRIILSYTQKLAALYGQAQYRFPTGHSLQAVGRWSFHARVKNWADRGWICTSHSLRASREGGDLLLDTAVQNVKLDRDVQLLLTDPRPTPDDVVAFSSAEQDGYRYLMLRYRPQLGSPARNEDRATNRRDWVFLYESSGDRDPLLTRAQVEVIRHLLSQAGPDDTFAVLAAGTRVRAFANEPRPVTPANVEEAIAFLEGAHLIGALDLGRALSEAQPLLKLGKNPYLVHVGSGIAAMGERRLDVLARRIPDGARYVGVGVGRRWDRGFMKAAAERSGGYFTQINPDEPIAWRAFDLAATLNTPRLLDVRVADRGGRAAFLPFTTLLAQGEELCAVTRVGPKEGLPEAVTVTGMLDGAKFERVLPVKEVADQADYLPRIWAKLEIDRLLAEDAAKHKDQIVALSSC